MSFINLHWELLGGYFLCQVVVLTICNHVNHVVPCHHYVGLGLVLQCSTHFRVFVVPSNFPVWCGQPGRGHLTHLTARLLTGQTFASPRDSKEWWDGVTLWQCDICDMVTRGMARQWWVVDGSRCVETNKSRPAPCRLPRGYCSQSLWRERRLSDSNIEAPLSGDEIMR